MEDYVAHRTLLGLLKGVGEKAYNGIRDKVVNNALNYMDLFYNPLHTQLFTPIEIRALNKARDVCAIVSQWHSEDTISERISDVERLLKDYSNRPQIEKLQEFVSFLPDGMNLEELKTFISTDNSEQQ